MKKTITLLFVTIISLLLFSSCDKNKDQEKEFSLVGKTYAIMSPHIGSYDSWRFFSGTELEITWRRDSPKGEIVGDIKYGTYILDYPELIVYANSSTYECYFINEDCFRTKLPQGLSESTCEFYLQ